MAYLLFECLSEEMPASMQRYAERQCHQTVKSALEENKLSYENLEIYTSPRRVTIIITSLPIAKKSETVELRGPRINATESAIDGFLRKAGKNKEDLIVKDEGKGEFYFLRYDKNSDSTELVLQKMLVELLNNFNWSKSMKWSNKNVKWIRPITNLLCLFDGRVTSLEFAGIKASDFTYGHKFKCNERLKISDYEDYKNKLKQNYVIFDQNERLLLIKKEIIKIAKTNKLNVEFDEELLEIINGLVEYPKILVGKIDKEFMSLPRQLLVTVMKNHQKYHSLLNKDGSLSSFFIIVSNNGDDEKVVQGNEKVLRARFTDAKFLVEQDLQNNLKHYSDKLSGITFHAKLGSLQDKVKRITTLSKYLSVWVPEASMIGIEESANLIKADLATKVVREFPELQGIIGSYYARCQKEKDSIIKVIKEHYYPLKADSEHTSDPIAVTLSIADKMDTIVGIISAGEKISGSRDPFTLRRLTIGLIRTILENDITLPINIAIEKSISLYLANLFKKTELLKIRKNTKETGKLSKNVVTEKIISFVMSRFKAMLKSQRINEKILRSVSANKKNCVLSSIYEEAKYLHQLMKTNEGKSLIGTYKRVKNILFAIEEKKQKRIRKNYNPALFVDEGEIKFHTELVKLKSEIKEISKTKDIKSSLGLLGKISVSADNFIDKVLINHNNRELCNNRLKILSYVRHLFNTVISFDEL
ncbi:MAG: glycine--tRNA ligase subunit beta [Rickettsiaceae bacterium H1]|nr:glycine--tRNA ligase subunit beta [Rickettsiaceae bacterium H1]